MISNGVIVYYSWVGNTKVVANEIKRLTGFPVQKIEEKKVRKFGNIAGAAMSALFGFRSSLKPMDYNLQEYDHVFLGVQVWAGKTTPAINQYLKKANFNNKQVWLFITKADEKTPQKVIDSITKRIEKKGGHVKESIAITTKWDSKTNIPIASEDVEKSISEWLKNVGVLNN